MYRAAARPPFIGAPRTAVRRPLTSGPSGVIQACVRQSSWQLCVTGPTVGSTYFMIDRSRPEFGALVFPDSHPQNVFPAVQLNANSDVYRLLYDLALAADMAVDGVQKHYGAVALQRSLLPLP